MPCHGTCVVLKATIAQKRLSGYARRSVHQPHRLGEHQEHHEAAERVERQDPRLDGGAERRRRCRSTGRSRVIVAVEGTSSC